MIISDADRQVRGLALPLLAAIIGGDMNKQIKTGDADDVRAVLGALWWLCGPVIVPLVLVGALVGLMLLLGAVLR